LVWDSLWIKNVKVSAQLYFIDIRQMAPLYAAEQTWV